MIAGNIKKWEEMKPYINERLNQGYRIFSNY
jgi:hypothetical protein